MVKLFKGLGKLLVSSLFFLGSVEVVAQEYPSSQSVFPEPREVRHYKEMKNHVGIFAGMSSVDGSGYDDALHFAIDVGYQPYIPFSLGAELNYAKNPSRYADQADLERTSALIKTSYNLGGDVFLLSNSYVGLAGGVVYSNVYGTDLTLAPLVGFDIPVGSTAGDLLSAGANLKYMFISHNELDAFIASAVMKYWF